MDAADLKGLRSRLTTAWEADHTEVYGPTPNVDLVKRAVRNHLIVLLDMAVEHINNTKPPHWPKLVRAFGSNPDLVAWVGTGPATGVRQCDMTDSVGPQTWYWQLPNQGAVPHMGYHDPIQPLFEMIEAVQDAGLKHNRERVNNLLEGLLD